jgi:hypothetical protein
VGGPVRLWWVAPYGLPFQKATGAGRLRTGMGAGFPTARKKVTAGAQNQPLMGA